jgi:hypothetical protein
MRAFFTDDTVPSLVVLVFAFVNDEFVDEHVDCPVESFERFFGHDDDAVS